jgi:hypothetical protein
MRTLVTLLLFLSFSTLALANETSRPWMLHEIGDGLYALEIDSTGTKCTIVELDESLCLIEVALSRRGPGVLTEDREGGEVLLRFLRERFPDKPLGFVMHTHWHAHSIASVTPFLEEGVALVTTRANFEKLGEFVDSGLVDSRADLIRFVEGDSMVIGEGPRKIVAYRLQKEEYPSLPATDYLFFHLAGHRALHCGCMYNKWSGEPVRGREILTTREQDVYKFIKTKGLRLDGLIRFVREDSATGQVLPFAGLEDVIANGVTAEELTAPFRELGTDSLRAARDRLVRDIISDGIPARLFNRLVYDALERQELARAKEFALLQVMAGPSNANAWDTLGEVHYFLGELAVARAYEKHSRRIDPDFSGGGEAVWEKDLAEHRKKWSEPSK